LSTTVAVTLHQHASTSGTQAARFIRARADVGLKPDLREQRLALRVGIYPDIVHMEIIGAVSI
jgi:hypothetical protein